jgi:hypothetical protein
MVMRMNGNLELKRETKSAKLEGAVSNFKPCTDEVSKKITCTNVSTIA